MPSKGDGQVAGYPSLPLCDIRCADCLLTPLQGRSCTGSPPDKGELEVVWVLGAIVSCSRLASRMRGLLGSWSNGTLEIFFSLAKLAMKCGALLQRKPQEEMRLW